MATRTSHCADASGRPQTDQGVHPSRRSLFTYNHIIMWLFYSLEKTAEKCFTKGFWTCLILCNTFLHLGSWRSMRVIGATDPDERWWLRISHKWLQGLTSWLFHAGLLGNRPLSQSLTTVKLQSPQWLMKNEMQVEYLCFFINGFPNVGHKNRLI